MDDEFPADYISGRTWAMPDGTVCEPYSDGDRAIGWHWRNPDGFEWYGYVVNEGDEFVVYDGPFGYPALDREVIRVQVIRRPGPQAG